MSQILERIKQVEGNIINKIPKLEQNAYFQIVYNASTIHIRLFVVIGTIFALCAGSIFYFKYRNSHEAANSLAVKQVNPLQQKNLEALNLYKQKKLQLALEAWKNLSIQYPDNWELKVNLAMVFEDLGDIHSAKEILYHLKSNKIEEPVIYNNLAILLLKENNQKESKELLNKSLKIKKNSVALQNLAGIYENEENWKAALSFYVEANALNKNPALEKKIKIIRRNLLLEESGENFTKLF